MRPVKPKRDQPWAVRGVSVEAREAALLAARDAGMNLGQWLDEVVREAASETIRGTSFKKDQKFGNEEAVRQLARDMVDMKKNIAQIGRNLDKVVAVKAGRALSSVVRAPERLSAGRDDPLQGQATTLLLRTPRMPGRKK